MRPAVNKRASALDRMRRAGAFIFDMDGVLYRGNAPLPGIADLFAALELRNVPYRLATNNSTSTSQQYVAKLAKMGIDVPASAIVTSAMATRDFLLKTLPVGASIFVVGEPALSEQLFIDDALTPDPYLEHQPAAVVVGLDRSFTYERLYLANKAIRGGSLFVATNGDVTLPTEEGLVPGCGSIVAAIAASTGQEPIVVGKPETAMLLMCIEQMGADVDETVVVGDRLDTDILSGNRAGMLTALMLTGVSTVDEVATYPSKPDLIFSDLNALLDAYTSAT
jgi:4-nitrophenyl phosphatase